MNYGKQVDPECQTKTRRITPPAWIPAITEYSGWYPENNQAARRGIACKNPTRFCGSNPAPKKESELCLECSEINQPLLFTYQSIVSFSPSSNITRALNPNSFSARDVTKHRLGCPSGFDVSQCIVPV